MSRDPKGPKSQRTAVSASWQRFFFYPAPRACRSGPFAPAHGAPALGVYNRPSPSLPAALPRSPAPFQPPTHKDAPALLPSRGVFCGGRAVGFYLYAFYIRAARPGKRQNRCWCAGRGRPGRSKGGRRYPSVRRRNLHRTGRPAAHRRWFAAGCGWPGSLPAGGRPPPPSGCGHCRPPRQSALRPGGPAGWAAAQRQARLRC